MSAGPLRHLVTLEQRAQAADASGGIAATFAAVAQVWAKVEATKGALYAAGVQLVEAPTHRIVIRYRPRADFDHVSELVLAPGASLTEDFDYLTGSYLAATERRWKVRDVRDPDGARRWLEIMAEELIAESGA